MDLLKKKNSLFNTELFQDWAKFAETIKKPSFREDVCELLNDLKSKIGQPRTVGDQLVREFVGSYTMLHFDMFDKNSTKDSDLYYKTVELHKSFDVAFNTPENAIAFFDNLKNYSIVFKAWKEHDEKVLVDKSCTQEYKQIKIIEDRFKNGTTPDEQQLSSSASMLRRKMENRIMQIGGHRAMQYVNDSPTLNPVDVMHIDMEETMKKAYWDMFEDDVNSNKLESISKNLDDFRNYFFSLLGTTVKANSIREQFDEQIDLELLKQMIESNAISGDQIYTTMKLIVHYVKQYVQSASEDKDTDMFLSNVYKKMEENKDSLGSILRYFFQNIFTKLDKTKIQMELLLNL